MADQRRYARYNVRIAAEADLFGRKIPVTITEISFEGLRLQTHVSMPPETLTAVTIMEGEHITFSGWVIWVLDKFMPEGQVYQTGIQTNAVTDAANQIIPATDREALIQKIIRAAASG